MKKINIIIASLFLLACSIVSVEAGPKELSEPQMTDVSVDGTITAKENKTDGTENVESNKNRPPSADDIVIINNPVDNPAELNKAEIFRLENQASEQRVNDQIKNNSMGIPFQE